LLLLSLKEGPRAPGERELRTTSFDKKKIYNPDRQGEMPLPRNKNREYPQEKGKSPVLNLQGHGEASVRGGSKAHSLHIRRGGEGKNP